MRFIAGAVLLFLAPVLFASHTVTSIEPNAGVVWGPTAVSIHGSGFTDPVEIFIGNDAPSFSAGMSLRVRDLSQNAQSFGTEIPLVTEADYHGVVNVPMQLVDVPTDPKYRATLRIYGPDEAPVSGVRVQLFSQSTVQLIEEYQVDLRGIVTAVFNPFPLHPSYAQLDPLTPAVRASGERVRIALYARRFSVLIPPPAIPLWAFVSIADNETQQVTTITPKR